MKRRRRKKRKNSWPNDHAGHSRAAKKGWRRRKSSSTKRKKRKNPGKRKGAALWKRLVKKYGVKKASRFYNKSTGSLSKAARGKVRSNPRRRRRKSRR